MNQKDRESLAKALRGIQTRLGKIEGNQKMLRGEVTVIGEDVKNLLLVMEETQNQQRASAGKQALSKNDATTRRTRGSNH